MIGVARRLHALRDGRRVRRGLRRDQHINENVTRFQRRLGRRAAERYARPLDWAERIEIVVPCFNHAPFLDSAYQSVAGQTYQGPLTVTFVDDASTDDSLAVMQRIRDDHREASIDVRILANSRNRNQAGSINKAVASSSAALFVMLNADDLLTPDCIELIVWTYAQHPEITMLGGASLPFTDETQLPEHRVIAPAELPLRVLGPQDALRFTHLDSIAMSQSSCSFFRPAWEIVGGYFPPRRRVCSFDDRDFQMRVCALLPVGVYEYPMEYYRTTSSQQRSKT